MNRARIKTAALLILLALPFKTASAQQKVDIDLTRMSATMTYVQVLNILYEPEQYDGKTIRMKGELYSFGEDETSRLYACLVQDVLACCAQGLEFEPSKNQRLPLPPSGRTVTVSGTLRAYQEDGFLRIMIVNALVE